jgi:hypothetical protein
MVVSTAFNSPGSTFISFTQQPPRALTPAPDGLPRSPFVPVRKHRSDSPPASPLSVRQTRSMAPPPAPSTRLASSTAPSPLLPSTAHNLPSLIFQSSSSPTEFRVPLPPRKVLQQQQAPPPPAPLSTAPRVRARITPAATPRRKVALPGTEFADIPPPRGGCAAGGAGGGPVKRAPLPLALTTPRQPLPIMSYGNFSTYGGGPSELNVEAVENRLAGLGLSSMGGAKRERKSKGQDSVLVCVR